MELMCSCIYLSRLVVVVTVLHSLKNVRYSAEEYDLLSVSASQERLLLLGLQYIGRDKFNSCSGWLVGKLMRGSIG